MLQSLPTAPTIDSDESLFFVEENRLTGRGIGFVDIHLLASAQLADVKLWTADKKLRLAAEDLKVAYR